MVDLGVAHGLVTRLWVVDCARSWCHGKEARGGASGSSSGRTQGHQFGESDHFFVGEALSEGRRLRDSDSPGMVCPKGQGAVPDPEVL